ncbi:MAG: ABC transporter permease, partial [Myxococcota bacterium]
THPGAQTLASRIRNLPEVAVATVRTYAFGLIANQEVSLGVQLLGLDLEQEETFGNWSDRIVDGSLLLGQMDDSILIGETAAQRLSIHVGVDVVIVAQAADGSLANRLFRVKGLYRSGISSLDERTVVFSQSHLQDFLALSNVGHEIAIQLHDNSETDWTAQRIKTLVPKAEHLLVRTWQEVSPTTGRLLGLQRVGTWIVVGVIFGVASLTILNTMLMSVLERVHEFGLLLALGLRPAQVVGLVSSETFLLTTL